MKKMLFIVTVSLLFVVKTQAQGSLEDYQRAEKFLWKNAEKLLYKERVNPKWIKKTTTFWYSVKTQKGRQYFLADEKGKRPAFNQEKFAESLQAKTEEKVTAYQLPIRKIEFSEDLKTMQFEAQSKNWKIDLKTYKIEEVEKPKLKKTQALSPNKKHIVNYRDFNLFLTDKDGKNEIQLTKDGEKNYAYGEYISWYDTKNESLNKEYEVSIDVKWSPDSKKILIVRYDRRKVEKLYLYQSLPDSGYRAQVYSYFRPVAGDSIAITQEFYIYDIEKQILKKVDLPPIATFLA